MNLSIKQIPISSTLSKRKDNSSYKKNFPEIFAATTESERITSDKNFRKL